MPENKRARQKYVASNSADTAAGIPDATKTAPHLTYGAPNSILHNAGFSLVAVDDLTADWGPVLEQRFAMYRALRDETEKAGTPSGFDAFYLSYERLVALVKSGALGGARFTAEIS